MGCVGAMVSPLFHDYDGEETAASVADAVRNLLSLADGLLDKLDERLDRIEARAANISQRAAETKRKVRAVAEMARSGMPVTVIAPSKYPKRTVAHGSTCFPFGIDIDPKTASNLLTEELTSAPVPAGSTNGDDKHIIDRLQQERIISKCLEDSCLEVPLRRSFDGVPFRLKTASEAVQFGTIDCFPYERNMDARIRIDSLDGPLEDEALEEDVKGPSSLAEAPSSFRNGDSAIAFSEYDVSYKPKMRDVARFDLPSNLNLPDIANISFLASEVEPKKQSIAPSVLLAELPELPSIFDLESHGFESLKDRGGERSLKGPGNEGLSTLGFSHEEHQSAVSSPPNTGQTRVVDKTHITGQSTGVDKTPSTDLPTTDDKGVSSTELPKPPPRPPLRRPQSQPLTSPPQSKQTANDRRMPTVTSVIGEDKSPGSGNVDLLAAIRNKDNLARLRRTAEEVRKGKAEEVRPSDGDGNGTGTGSSQDRPLSLAEEMRLKLARRQKIISGQLDKEEQNEDRSRVGSFRTAVRVVQAAGKLKSATSESNPLFSLDNLPGIYDLLEARNAKNGDDDGLESASDSSWED